MSFICRNGTPHRHDTIEQSKVCWGVASASGSYADPRPYSGGHAVPDPITPKQLDYIKNHLTWGDLDYARRLTKKQASEYIDHLKKNRPTTSTGRGKTTMPPDPRLDLIKGMIELVPDGYFAVRADDTAPISFLRLSHPTHHKYKGSLKIQTQHGPNLDIAAALWPSGQFSIYKTSIVDDLMLLVSDYQGAALRYAQEIGRCCRCNAELTDDRSRHYGIGPVCDKEWPFIIDMVDSSNDGMSFEQLRAAGLLRTANSVRSVA